MFSSGKVFKRKQKGNYLTSANLKGIKGNITYINTNQNNRKLE